MPKARAPRDPSKPKKPRAQTEIGQLRVKHREALKEAKRKVTKELRELRALGIKKKTKK